MADHDPPPAKPKPGSLRDRIAAFEQKPASDAGVAHPPPAPRPKPGNVQWKPKVASPPSSPPATGSGDNSSVGSSRGKFGGMSAADAKESIGIGGSLKDRMAALQGRGGFGAPAPAPPPKPVSEKPKWKPPPVVSPPVAESDEEPAVDSLSQEIHEDDNVPAASVTSNEQRHDVQEQPASELEDETPKENDQEEEERQRRAAIAARMARLGGARVGMGPPVFGYKPPVRKPDSSNKNREPGGRPVVGAIKTDAGHLEGLLRVYFSI